MVTSASLVASSRSSTTSPIRIWGNPLLNRQFPPRSCWSAPAIQRSTTPIGRVMVFLRRHPHEIGDKKVSTGSDGRGNSSSNAWRRALEMTASIAENTSVTFPTIIETLSDTFDSAISLFSDQQCLTYRALAERANRYARWALGHRLGAGDVVCLLMPNCPEYMAIWLGITRIGAVVSLLNTNLVGSALEHSINIVAPKHIIVGADLL